MSSAFFVTFPVAASTGVVSCIAAVLPVCSVLRIADQSQGPDSDPIFGPCAGKPTVGLVLRRDHFLGSPGCPNSGHEDEVQHLAPTPPQLSEDNSAAALSHFVSLMLVPDTFSRAVLVASLNPKCREQAFPV